MLRVISQVRWFSHRPPGIRADEFISRRSALLGTGKSEFKSSSPVAAVVKGATRTPYAPDVYYPFKQDSYFRYLCGVVVPDSFLFFDQNQAVLFVKESSEHSTLWDGCRFSESDLKKISGVDQVLGLKEFEKFIVKNVLNKQLILEADNFKDLPLIEILMRRPQSRLTTLVDKLRWIKSPAEIELMRKTCEIGSESMNSAIKKSKFVTNEAHIAGRLEFEYKIRGTAGSAYTPVVAAGARANTIHYIDADQEIEPGDCVLIDAGCDLDGYVSDISRNFPVSGRFTDIQRTLYDALEAVHTDCLQYVKNQRPLKLNELYFKMLRCMAHYFKEAGVFDPTICEEDAYGICDDLCPHHISHYLGMDVHDTFSIPRNIELQPGVIITVEPGVYIRENIPGVRPEFKGIGFRIEDDVLIGKTDAEVLTIKCVRGSEELEKILDDY